MPLIAQVGSRHEKNLGHSRRHSSARKQASISATSHRRRGHPPAIDTATGPAYRCARQPHFSAALIYGCDYLIIVFVDTNWRQPARPPVQTTPNRLPVSTPFAQTISDVYPKLLLRGGPLHGAAKAESCGLCVICSLYCWRCERR